MDPATIRAEVGLPADAPDDDVLTAVREYRDAAARAAAQPDDVRRLAAALDERGQEVRGLSEQLAELRAERAADQREQFLARATSEGRIAPAERDRFARLWDSDRDLAAEMVADRAVGSAVPVGEVGHGRDTEPTDDDVLAAMFGESKGV